MVDYVISTNKNTTFPFSPYFYPTGLNVERWGAKDSKFCVINPMKLISCSIGSSGAIIYLFLTAEFY